MLLFFNNTLIIIISSLLTEMATARTVLQVESPALADHFTHSKQHGDTSLTSALESRSPFKLFKKKKRGFILPVVDRESSHSSIY